MTKEAQEAYIRGFCKTAEAYGVDPEQLIKVAKGKKGGKKLRRMLQEGHAKAIARKQQQAASEVIKPEVLEPDFTPIKPPAPPPPLEPNFIMRGTPYTKDPHNTSARPTSKRYEIVPQDGPVSAGGKPSLHETPAAAEKSVPDYWTRKLRRTWAKDILRANPLKITGLMAKDPRLLLPGLGLGLAGGLASRLGGGDRSRNATIGGITGAGAGAVYGGLVAKNIVDLARTGGFKRLPLKAKGKLGLLVAAPTLIAGTTGALGGAAFSGKKNPTLKQRILSWFGKEPSAWEKTKSLFV